MGKFSCFSLSKGKKDFSSHLISLISSSLDFCLFPLFTSIVSRSHPFSPGWMSSLLRLQSKFSALSLDISHHPPPTPSIVFRKTSHTSPGRMFSFPSYLLLYFFRQNYSTNETTSSTMMKSVCAGRKRKIPRHKNKRSIKEKQCSGLYVCFWSLEFQLN